MAMPPLLEVEFYDGRSADGQVRASSSPGEDADRASRLDREPQGPVCSGGAGVGVASPGRGSGTRAGGAAGTRAAVPRPPWAAASPPASPPRPRSRYAKPTAIAPPANGPTRYTQ